MSDFDWLKSAPAGEIVGFAEQQHEAIGRAKSAARVELRAKREAQAERDEWKACALRAEAEAAVMREALRAALGTHGDRCPTGADRDDACEVVTRARAALSSSAGSDLLSALKKAREALTEIQEDYGVGKRFSVDAALEALAKYTEGE